MAEYIEREEIFKKYEEIQTRNEQWRFETLINSIPSTDVALVAHGRWKYYKKQGIAVCTCCSFERNLDDDFGRAISCPNCGARMDLDAE